MYVVTGICFDNKEIDCDVKTLAILAFVVIANSLQDPSTLVKYRLRHSLVSRPF